MRELVRMLDYSEYGGAPLLGVKACPSSATAPPAANAIKNAIRVAVQAVEVESERAHRRRVRPARSRSRVMTRALRGDGRHRRRRCPPGVLTNADLEPHARHVGRVDRRAHRHPGAPHRRGRTQTVAMLSREAQRAGAGARRRHARRSSTPSCWPRPRPTGCCPPPPATCRRCSAPSNAAAFDICAACPGFVYALTVAEGMIARAERDGARGRRREAVHHHRLPGPLDRHSVRRRRRRRGGPALAASTAAASSSTFIKSDGRLAPLLYRPGRRRGRPDQREGGLRAVALHEDGRPRGLQVRGAGHGRGLRRGARAAPA